MGPKEGVQGLGHGDDRGGGGEVWAEPSEGVEDKRAIEDGRVVLSECVGEMLLAMAVVGDRGGALKEYENLYCAHKTCFLHFGLLVLYVYLGATVCSRRSWRSPKD
jgi:hypothetical protein